MSLNRRQILQNGSRISFAATVVTLGGACTQKVDVPQIDLTVFSPEQAATLVSLVETVLHGLTPVASPEQMVQQIDTSLTDEHETLRAKIRDAVLFLEWAPQFSLRFKPFSKIDRAGRDDVLRKMSTSSLKTKRTVYQALVGMTLFAYADDPSAWDHMGYDGPLLQPGVAQ